MLFLMSTVKFSALLRSAGLGEGKERKTRISDLRDQEFTGPEGDGFE